ncbi:MAG: M20 family metallopeptidase [Desulfofustis sp. PB-SRB1]|nr:M20 family metallopeptidase [Desulfofustis sp. PB-SRB1]MBM1002935.1 M20 family metallopeptidase [Desulfofustis sp. PB-SRB1]
MNEPKQLIEKEVEAMAETLFSVSEFLLHNPETAYQEFKACEHISEVLRRNGFAVEEGAGDVETAFLARPAGCKATRPAVALLAEYDALPKIGHGCGHNLIAAAGVGAALALTRVLGENAGGVALVGTPAEEGGGGKVRLIKGGVFANMDAAMMIHPGQYNIIGKGMLGRIKFTMAFHGRTAHAAGSPDQGINALDALVLAYNGINSLRQHLRPDARIHGIITKGGDAPNIIPDYTEALFYVRAETIDYREEIFNRVLNCATSAAAAVGGSVDIHVHEPSTDPMRHNHALQDAFIANMGLLNIAVDKDPGRTGSSDMGNLSQYMPAIHPYLAICDDDIPSHSTAFRDATVSERGKAALLKGAKLLAMTAYDFLTSENLREQITKDFAAGMSSQGLH